LKNKWSELCEEEEEEEEERKGKTFINMASQRGGGEKGKR
jgi:hypothetical protein